MSLIQPVLLNLLARLAVAGNDHELFLFYFLSNLSGIIHIRAGVEQGNHSRNLQSKVCIHKYYPTSNHFWCLSS